MYTDDGPPVNDMLSTAKLLPVTQKEKSATTAFLDYDNESDSVEIESTTTTIDDDLNSQFYTTTAPIPISFLTSNLTSICSQCIQ